MKVTMREQMAQMRKDAERYRWLRANPDYMGWEHDFMPHQIDAEIDRVIAERAANARAAHLAAATTDTPPE